MPDVLQIVVIIVQNYSVGFPRSVVSLGSYLSWCNLNLFEVFEPGCRVRHHLRCAPCGVRRSGCVHLPPRPLPVSSVALAMASRGTSLPPWAACVPGRACTTGMRNVQACAAVLRGALTAGVPLPCPFPAPYAPGVAGCGAAQFSDLDAFDRLVFIAGIPLVLLILLGLIYASMPLLLRCCTCGGQPLLPVSVHRTRVVKVVLVLLFFVYPSVSSEVVKAFRCVCTLPPLPPTRPGPACASLCVRAECALGELRALSCLTLVHIASKGAPSCRGGAVQKASPLPPAPAHLLLPSGSSPVWAGSAVVILRREPCAVLSLFVAGGPADAFGSKTASTCCRPTSAFLVTVRGTRCAVRPWRFVHCRGACACAVARCLPRNSPAMSAGVPCAQ
jgi:hypothetical protein